MLSRSGILYMIFTYREQRCSEVLESPEFLQSIGVSSDEVPIVEKIVQLSNWIWGLRGGVNSRDLIQSLTELPENNNAYHLLPSDRHKDLDTISELVPALQCPETTSAPPVLPWPAEQVDFYGMDIGLPSGSWEGYQRKPDMVSSGVAALCSKNVWNRVSGAVFLAKLGPYAQQSLTALEEAERDRSKGVRLLADWAARRIGEETEVTANIDRFTDILGDRQSQTRWAAARILGLSGFPTETVVPPLMRQLNDANIKVREAVGWALADLGTEATRHVLCELEGLTGVEFSRGADALGVIGMFAGGNIGAAVSGSDIPRAVHVFARALADEHDRTRAEAVSILGSIGPPAKVAVDRLLELANDKSTNIRANVAWAIMQIAPSDERVQRTFEAMRKDRSKQVQRAISEVEWDGITERT